MKPFFALAALLLCASAVTFLSANDPEKTARVPLPTSKWLTTPSPGYLARLNSFPATIAVSPDGRYAALLNDGYGTQATQAHQSISILDLNTNQLTDYPDDRLPESAHQSYFLGLAFSSDGSHLYASIGSITDPTGAKPGDTGNGIAVYKFKRGNVVPERFLKIAPQEIPPGRKVAYGLRKTAEGTAIPYPAGLSVISGPSGDHLLIANNLADNVVVLDPADGRILQQFDLSTHKIVPSSFPYTVVASRDGHRAWCSLWNSSRVAELDLEKGIVARWISLLEPEDPIAPGSHPTALLLSPDQKLLYVALSNADRVAVVSAADGRVLAFLDSTASAQKYPGTYPTALAQSSDGTHLFVADSSLNAVAVFDVTKFMAGTASEATMQPLGFIPTDWYPSALATVGDDLLIATAKGRGTGPNNGLSQLKQERRHHNHPYIPTLLYGSLSRLNLRAAERQLPEMTRQVEASNLFHADPGRIEFHHGSSPIRHVIYVLKENRTYDQIFGDLKVGNGDPSLTTYGADITPNEHQLALQFGVLDNFYDSGEVSGDGHVWSNAAITSDYNEKTWQIGYRSEERTYDYQGNVADELPLENHEPDVDAPATGYLWDNLAGHGVSYRDYGEFVDAVWCKPPGNAPAPPPGDADSPLHGPCPQQAVRRGEPLPSHLGQPHGSPSPWPWAVPLLRGVRPTKAALIGHFDPNFPDFNTDYPDQLRADEFLDEFDGFVRAREQGKDGQLPAFVLLYLPDDHTGGTRRGKPRPAASVADNDLALGRVVEAVSHSPYWDDTAIFVIEDDAQDGADHVDAHRSIALVISKYSPGSVEHPFVDHRFYTTVNMVHTMETLLGLPPMNQNDAYAPVMAPLFTGEGNQLPFSADYRNRDNGLIYQINPARAAGSEESEKMDFSRPDAANAARLNAILWRDRKGDVPMPAPRHTVFPQKAAPDND
ncbi:MAG TPA: beta-propeller fold lactonase family protein [Terriglobales bacterium]|nr:beta-propeller fold lactonase family protein [Terriglobales bacterium]